jgi:hypothetical protein
MTQAFGKLPLTFEINQGQTDGAVKFLSRGRGYSLFLTPAGAALRLKGKQDQASVVRWQTAGGNRNPRMIGESQVATKSNYFIGNDPSKWHTEVPNYAKVRAESVYPGVDLVYHGNRRQMEYDFVVAPNANPSKIRLAFQGVESMRVGTKGELILHTANGDLVQPRPTIYQEKNGQRQLIEGRYALLAKNEIGFKLGRYDRNRELTIDPVLLYSSFLGDSDLDEGTGVAVDGSGNLYVTGFTGSTSFPGVDGSSLQPTKAYDWDIFLTKINPAGTATIYSTYIGGDGFNEYSQGITIDGSGNVYLTGGTNSSDFPGASGSSIQSTFSGGYRDAFAMKINAAGSAIVYSTYLGGSGDDLGTGIAVDGSGNAYVTGDTEGGFPGISGSSIQSTHGGGGYDIFLTKINSGGTAQTYSTYLGDSGDDSTSSVVVDGSGNAYISGATSSTAFPGVSGGSLQSSNAGGYDALIAKINSGGTAVSWATFIGGSSDDSASAIRLDGSGNVYVDGRTDSSSFPGVSGGSIQSSNAGNGDVFVMKLNSSATSITYSTFLGGSDIDATFNGGLAIDSSGNAYITGATFSTSFPGVSGSSLQAANAGGIDGFITRINAAGTAIDWSTFLGGTSDDIVIGAALDGSGNIYVTGWTYSTDYPVTAGSLQTTYGGGVIDAFVAKIGPPGSPVISSISPSTGHAGDSITITGTGFDNVQGSGNVWLGSNYKGSIVSWSNTQIVATIASGVTSGVAEVLQSSVWSNTISLTVITPHITSISASTGRAGDQITITGTGFGSSQGSGLVWLGSTYASVVSWSDTSIVATIASGSTSGVADVYQYGVWSNTLSLTVITPNITSISPNHGTSGTQITFTGTGFGSSQGSGNVWLGSVYAGSIVSWSDTQIVATVASSASGGVAQVYQGGVWSNSFSFSVP